MGKPKNAFCWFTPAPHPARESRAAPRRARGNNPNMYSTLVLSDRLSTATQPSASNHDVAIPLTALGAEGVYKSCSSHINFFRVCTQVTTTASPHQPSRITHRLQRTDPTTRWLPVLHLPTMPRTTSWSRRPTLSASFYSTVFANWILSLNKPSIY